VRIALANTPDFNYVERISLITEAAYRNVAIFPERIDGLYARLDRPHSEIAPWSIWISYSPDLHYWGDAQLCGAVAESDGAVKIYWGGADTVMCMGEADVSDLVAPCLDHGRAAR